MLARRSLWAWATEARERRVALNIKGRLVRAECFGARAIARGCLEGWLHRCVEVNLAKDLGFRVCKRVPGRMAAPLR